MKHLPTKLTKLPYPGAPLTMHDLVMQQARRDEMASPSCSEAQPLRPPQDPAVMRKELPDTSWDALTRHMWSHQITRFMHSLI